MRRYELIGLILDQLQVVLFEARLKAYSLRATSHTRLKARDHCILKLLLVKKTKTVQVHSTLQGEGRLGPNFFLSWMKKSTWSPTQQIINNVSWYVV